MTKKIVTRAVCAGLCSLSLALAACSGSSSGGSGDDGSSSHADSGGGGGASSQAGGGGQPSGPASASEAAEQGGGGAKTAPTSCDPLKPVVQRDLGVTITKVTFAPEGQTPDGAPASVCELLGGTSTIIDVSYAVEDDSEQALAESQQAKDFAPHIGLTPHDLAGIGDQAFYVADSTGKFAWLAVVTGNLDVFLKQAEGNVALAKWQSLAKDTVAGLH